MNLNWNLESRSYLTEEIVCRGIFEPTTTRRVLERLRAGMTVLDVGANVGYFTVLMARAVSPGGRVIAFEPTAHYRELCAQNISNNGYQDIVLLRSEALSDRTADVPISIGKASATLHWSDPASGPRASQVVHTRSLDDLVDELSLSRLDFVKVDIDGHEPSFLRGAEKTLRRFHPVLVIEFAEHCLHTAGTTALELRRQLIELDYSLVDEKTMVPFASEMSFLMECGNYAFSANVFAVPTPSHHARETASCDSGR